MAEKYPGWSPYNYTLQNPVNFTDPDGRSVDGDYFSKDGKYLGSDGKDDNKIYISSGDKTNYLTSNNKEVPGGLHSLGAIKTSLKMTNDPSLHNLAPDRKGGLHEVRFDIDLDGHTTKYFTGQKARIEGRFMKREVNAYDIGFSDVSGTDILGHSHPTRTVVKDGKFYTIDALTPTQPDLKSFKNYDFGIISGNIENKPVTRNSDESYNMPDNAQGGVFYNPDGSKNMKINIKTINKILSNYEGGKLKE